MFDDNIMTKAAQVIDGCREAKLLMVTVESCTGGLLTGALTAIPGSSAVIDRGYITYSLHGKVEMVGVPAQMLGENGAVSAPVARAMAGGALSRCQPRIKLAVAITGVAGPGSTSPTKAAGLDNIAVAHEGPDLAPGRVREFPVVEVAHEAGLVDRHQRPQAHRHRRELPEVRHQPRMRVGRKAKASDLTPEMA